MRCASTRSMFLLSRPRSEAFGTDCLFLPMDRRSRSRWQTFPTSPRASKVIPGLSCRGPRTSSVGVLVVG
jgi:hypothetical protein